MKTYYYTCLLILNFCCSPLFSQVDPAHEKEIKTLIFSDDGKYLISGGEDNMVRIWEVRTGKMAYALKHENPVRSISISPDNNYMISSSAPSSHCLWDIKAGKQLKCLADHEIKGFTSDSKSIVVISYTEEGKKAEVGIISLKDFDRFYFPKKFETSKGLELTYASDGNKIYVADGSKYLYTLDKNKPEIISRNKIRKEPGKIIISKDENFLLAQNLYQYFDMKTWKPTHSLQDSMYIETAGKIKFTSDGKYLMCYNSYQVNLLTSDSGKFVKSIDLPLIKGISALSADAGWMAFSKEDNTLSLINLNEEKAPLQSLVGVDFVERNAFQNYLRGVYFYTIKNQKQAIKYLSAAEGKTDRAEKLYLYRGQAYLQMHEYRKAIADFKKDSLVQPRRGTLNIAKAYLGKNDLENGLFYLQAYQISKQKERWSALVRDSIIQNISGEEQWVKFADNNPLSEAEKLVNIADERFKKGDKLGAIEFMNKALALEPGNASLYEARALLYSSINEYDNAIADFLKEAKLNPEKLPNAYQNIAKIYYRKGMLEKTIALLEESLKMDPSNFSLLLDIAELQESVSDHKEAVKTLDRYLDIIPDNHYAYYLRANSQRNEKNRLEDINKAISLCQENGQKVPLEYYEILPAPAVVK